MMAQATARQPLAAARAARWWRTARCVTTANFATEFTYACTAHAFSPAFHAATRPAAQGATRPPTRAFSQPRLAHPVTAAPSVTDKAIASWWTQTGTAFATMAMVVVCQATHVARVGRR